MKHEGKVLDLPDWETLLVQFKEGPQENDPKRNENFIIFNRLALMAIKKDWWSSSDRGVARKKRNIHRAFTASDFAFALIMFGNWSADSVRHDDDHAGSSSTSGASARDGSSVGGSKITLKRKKVLCGDELVSAIKDYHATYGGLRKYWMMKEEKAIVKKWNKVIEDHDEERIVKCRGHKRKDVGPGQNEDKRAKLVDFSLMEDFDSLGKGDSDDEEPLATSVVQL